MNDRELSGRATYTPLYTARESNGGLALQKIAPKDNCKYI